MIELKLTFNSREELLDFLLPCQPVAATPMPVAAMPECPVVTAAVAVEPETKKRGRPRKISTPGATPGDAQPEVASASNSGSDEVGVHPSPAVVAVDPEPETAAVETGAGDAVQQTSSAPAHVTADAVREALKELAQTKGIGAVTELLKSFNATRVSEISEDRLAEVLAAAQS